MTEHDPSLVARALRQAIREDFFSFLRKSFGTLHPGRGTEFVPAWHIRAICHELDDVRRGANQRLVINIPPRCLKSVTVAVAWTAWLLGRDPGMKIIVASYGLDLAKKHSDDCRRIMETDWYRQTFPVTRLASRGNSSEEFKTTQGGGRKAVSIGSSVTGHGADLIIIDDLLKAGDAASEVELERAQDFIEGTLLSRFDNPAEGRVVLIAQRLHEHDPAGYLLDKGTYRHLNLPAIAEEDQMVAIGNGQMVTRETGTALFPERLDLETLERMRREMGAAVFNCQYQQNPIAPDGSPLKWERFGTYCGPQERNSFQLVVQSWDTGMSADPRSDFSVCTTWGLREGKWYLLDLYRAQLEYPDLKRKVIALYERWRADKVLIEAAGSGIPLLQDCQYAGRRAFVRVKPTQEKGVRFNAACAPVEEGLVLLPEDAPWLAAFKRELQSFPRGRNDDQVDSFSQFLNWQRSKGWSRSLDRDHPIRVDRQRERERRFERARR